MRKNSLESLGARSSLIIERASEPIKADDPELVKLDLLKTAYKAVKKRHPKDSNEHFRSDEYKAY